MVIYPAGSRVFQATCDQYWRGKHFLNSDYLISNLPDLPEGWKLVSDDPKTFVRPVPRGVNADITVHELFA